jgi:hypothetical protein
MTFRRVLTTAMVAGMVALTPAVAFAGSKVARRPRLLAPVRLAR